MKIVDSSSALLWSMQRSARRGPRKPVAQPNAQVDQTLRNKMRELHRLSTTTMKPDASGYYAEGRKTLSFYQQGFVQIDAFNDAYRSSMQNARLTDKEILDIIEKMNLTPR